MYTKVCLSRQNIFVATNTTIFLTCFVATKVSLSRQNFCHDKNMFVATKVLSRQKACFVATKIIFVAAPANDRLPPVIDENFENMLHVAISAALSGLDLSVCFHSCL